MRAPPLLRDGPFLEMKIEHDCPRRRITIVYLKTLKNHELLLTEEFASVENIDLAALFERARALCPAALAREEENLAAMQDLFFVPEDVHCDSCGARPGEACFGSACFSADRSQALRHFLVWLAEQRSAKPTKKLIVQIAEMLGYCTAAHNLYYREQGVVVASPRGPNWRLYFGGKLDPTNSVWMTRRADLTKPEGGPLRDAVQIAVAIRDIGRS